EVETVLDGLLVCYGHEADAHRGSLVGADDDLPFVLGQDLPIHPPDPEPGEARQIMPIHGDVIQRPTHDRQCASRWRAADHSMGRCATASAARGGRAATTRKKGRWSSSSPMASTPPRSSAV